MLDERLRGVTPEAREIFRKMGQHAMRLIVPIGDAPLTLISDPRFRGYENLQQPRETVQKAPVLELIRKGMISPLPENTPHFKLGEGGKIGWREMFKGHEAVVPEGAQVYACTQ